MGSDETWGSWLRWIPTSEELLKNAEMRMFEGFHTAFKEFFVPITNGYKVRTIETIGESERLPLVLLHGFGAGVGLWTLNLDALAEKQKVYAIDLLGFGRSSRPEFPTVGSEAEDMFVQSIEQWREKVGLQKFILLGHSFGGYLAAAYTISYPERVRHLILADPWGMPEKKPETEENFHLPMWAKGVAAVLSLFNPLASIRAAGPLGPSILRRVRPDLKKKFSKIFEHDDTRVIDYIYHINAQQASGEVAFMSLTIPYGWAKYPMIHRIKDIDTNLPISIVFGSRSWMDVISGGTVKFLRPKSYVNVQIIKGAGHHVYADKPVEFNNEVNKICDDVDSLLDSGPSKIEGLENLTTTNVFDKFDS